MFNGGISQLEDSGNRLVVVVLIYVYTAFLTYTPLKALMFRNICHAEEF